MARNYRLPKNYKETDIKFSVRDLSMPKATTLMQCLNIPIFGEELISHDKFRIKFASLLQSNALQTPLFGRYKLRVSTFNCPMTNYYGFMDNNTKLTADEWDAMPHWTISPTIRGLSPAGVSFDSNLYDPTVQPNVDYFFADQYKRFFAAVGPLAQIASVVPYYYGRLLYDRKEYADATGATHELRPNEFYRALYVKPGSMLDYSGVTPGYVYHDGTVDGSSVFLTNGSVSGGPVFIKSYFDSSSSPVGFSYNAHFLIAYLDCVRSYLVNKQLSYAVYTVVVGEETDGDVGINVIVPDTGGSIVLDNDGVVSPSGQILISVPLDALDSFFIWLRSQNEPRDLYEAVHDEWLKVLSSSVEEARNHWSSHILVWLFSLRFGGLFCCTYESDMLQNLLTDVEGAEAFVDIIDGKFSINDFRMANRKQRKRERVAVSGGRYKDILRALWNAKSRSGVDIPDFINTTSFMIDPRNIVSTADTEVPDASSDGNVGKSLGQMAGNVNQYKPGKYKHTIRTEDPSQVMMIVSLVPEVMYSDGVDKNLLSLRFSDDYSPQFDQVGFQDVPSILYNMLPAVIGVESSPDGVRLSPNDVSTVVTVGKNVAWMRYLTNVGRVHGRFVRGFDYDSFVLTRDYRPNLPFPVGNVNNPPLLETAPNGYAVPMDYQYPFIIQRSDFPNWFFQLDLNIRATRAIGKNYMPTLGK